MPKGQIYYRNSATYINEFGIAGDYFHVSLGAHLFRPMLRAQGNLPIKNFLHIGLAAEINIENQVFLFNPEFDRATFSLSPILTVGNPNYFVNLTYRSKAPIFLPINDNEDNNLIRKSNYWSFGGGLKIGRKFQFLTETMLIEDKNRQKHLKVYNGITGSFGRHTIGVGVSVYDTHEVTSTNTFLVLNTGSVYPSMQYTIRIR